jgi:hypothetical protein
MKYLYRNDSIWKFVTIFAIKIDKMFFLQPIILRSFKESMRFFFTNGYLSLKFEHFAVLSKNIRYYFDNKNLQERNYKQISNKFLRTF